MRAAYNGQAVGFGYTGASQTPVLSTNWNTNAAEGWDASTGANFTQNYSSGNMVLTATGQQYASHASMIDSLVEGKQYRVKFTASAIQGTFKLVQTSPSTVFHTVANGANEFTFTAGSQKSLYFTNTSGTTGDTITIDDFSITRIGCVAEYLPSGISATKWINSSGTSGLDGTVTSATAINHEVGSLTMVDNIVMASGKGIDFSATSDATGKTSEVLDDYEEGEFTVTSSTTGITVHTSKDAGSYVKIGSLVHIQGMVEFSASSSPSADLILSGLPFASSDLTEKSGYTAITVSARNLVSSIPSGSYVVAFIPEGTSDLYIRAQGGTGNGDLLGSRIDTGSDINFSGTYRTG